jgi:hypothetical protein
MPHATQLCLLSCAVADGNSLARQDGKLQAHYLVALDQDSCRDPPLADLGGRQARRLSGYLTLVSGDELDLCRVLVGDPPHLVDAFQQIGESVRLEYRAHEVGRWRLVLGDQLAGEDLPVAGKLGFQ